MSIPAIRTTVVGSYPVPDWLMALPSQQGLIDATKVIFQTQELAGIDVVADGELYRWDVNHPETNGMIEYFIRPMAGIRTTITRQDVEAFRKIEGMRFRAEPAGIVEGPIGEGTLRSRRRLPPGPRLYRSPDEVYSDGPAYALKDAHGSSL